MCNCFSLAASAPAGSSSLFASSSPHTGKARSRDREAGGTWIDVHAHPGRSFLRGLEPSDSLFGVLGHASVDQALVDLREGGLDAAVFATVADLRVLSIDPTAGIRAGREFEPGEAYRDHLRQLGALRELADAPSTRILLEPADLDSRELGVLLSCEGADFLEGRLERVEEAAQMGVRTITLVHYRVNELGDIQTEAPRHDGLTPFGVDVVKEMNRLGMLIDLAHATFDVTRQVLDASQAPVMISHSHLAGTADAHPRLLSLEHAKAVTKDGGLIGAWPSGVALETFDDYLDEILRLVDHLGVAGVSIGTDMDANYRPVVDRYQQFPDIAEGLKQRGLAADEVDAIMGGNFWRLFSRIRA